jgi:hypothetical protein
MSKLQDKQLAESKNGESLVSGLLVEGRKCRCKQMGGSGGTGRRARLRILWPKNRGGSSPLSRTTS